MEEYILAKGNNSYTLTIGGEGGDPKPPPRGRANPFNSGGEVVFSIRYLGFYHIYFLQQVRKVRKGWKEVHSVAGRRVKVEFNFQTEESR